MRITTMLVLVLGLTVSARADDSAVCAFSAGALPVDTLAPGTPHGSAIPIEHIVVLMQENRSFDHYFGRLRRSGQRKAEGEPAKASNPNPLGGAPIAAFHQKQACEVADLDHSWNGTHHEWNGGAMDGFTAANVDPGDTTGSRTMGYHTQKELKFYYKLYRENAIADHYFCSVLSQTFPNRFFLLAATSFGHIRNDFSDLNSATDFAQTTIFERLDAAGVSWRIYHSGLPFGFLFGYVRTHGAANLKKIEDLEADAQAGTLPQVAFVDPIFVGDRNTENDEHPPANIQVGEVFVHRVLSALVESPNWPTTAFFLTYDEHGGYYDHVPPPPACVPDAIPPLLETNDVVAGFDRYGIRVPLLVLSPYAKRKFVSHRTYDHTSILRFIETRFDLPALTRRDANADPMLDLFDFSKARKKKPSLGKPPVPDPDLFAACAGLPPVTETGP